MANVLVPGDLRDQNVTYLVQGDFMVLTANKPVPHVTQAMEHVTTERGNVNVHLDLPDFSAWSLVLVVHMGEGVWGSVVVGIAVTATMSLGSVDVPGDGWGRIVHSHVRLGSLVQIVFIIVTAIMVRHATQWMVSVSANLALRGTGAKTCALRDTLVRIATRHVAARLKTISATQHLAVYASLDLMVPIVRFLCQVKAFIQILSHRCRSFREPSLE